MQMPSRLLRDLAIAAIFLHAISATAEQRVDWSRLESPFPSWPIVSVGDPIPTALIQHWESSQISFACPGLNGHYDAFPSKRSTDDKNTNNFCNHLDSTLFNGLLCAAGLEEGCRATQQAQNQYTGMWTRSPRQRYVLATQCPKPPKTVGTVWYCKECVNSLSPDMGLGAMLYVIEKHDYAALNRWIQGVERTGRSTEICKRGSCRSFPWPRLSDDDHQCIAKNPDGTTNDLNSKIPKPVNGYSSGMSILKPGSDADDYDLITTTTRIRKGALLTKAIVDGDLLFAAVSGISPVPVLLPPPLRDSIAAQFVASDFPLHLEATRVLLRMMINNPKLSMNDLPDLPSLSQLSALPGSQLSSLSPPVLHERARIISSRQPWNPFFSLLANGPTANVREKIIDACPEQQDSLPEDRDAEVWRWETNDAQEQDVAHSMGWDCVFVGLLFNKMRTRTDLNAQLMDLFKRYADPLKVSLDNLQSQLGDLQDAHDKAVSAATTAHQLLIQARALVGPGVASVNSQIAS